MPPDPRQALALWGMEDAAVALAAQRENTVWRVSRDGRDYALRFHRPGYRTDAELRAELQWMHMLAAAGLELPDPVSMPGGDWVGRVGGQRVSLLTWLPGHPIGETGRLHDIADPETLCRTIGQHMARLHDLTDRWTPPAGFTRPDWRREGLVGDRPLWGRFWDHPHLSTEQRALLCEARATADADLVRIEATADQGLIHADLLAENVLIQDGRVAFIDFDDCAFGFRDFELATFLCKFANDPDFGQMRAALCAGYAARRDVRAADLDLFLLIRALTYPGWIADRLAEPGAAERSTRAIGSALHFATEYLTRRRS